MDAAIWVVSGGVVGILGFAFSVWKFHSGERGKIYTRIAEVQGELNAFKLYAASHFASVPSLEAATTKMATAVDGMNKRLDDMARDVTGRLDRVFEAISTRPKNQDQ